MSERVDDGGPVLARIAELEAEVARLSKPDWFWDAQDPEESTASWQDLITDALCPDEIMKIGCARDLPRKWGATRCLTVDENGDPDEREPVLFDTKAEARACWPDSLKAARSALGDQP